VLEPAINSVAFYFHEMVWKKVEKKEGVVKEQSDDSSQQLSSSFPNNEATFAS